VFKSRAPAFAAGALALNAAFLLGRCCEKDATAATKSTTVELLEKQVL
jgi:hypothetical protein